MTSGGRLNCRIFVWCYVASPFLKKAPMNLILTPEHVAALHDLAGQRGQSETALLHEAVERFLREAIETARYHTALNAFATMGADSAPVVEAFREGRAEIEVRQGQLANRS